MMHDLLQPIEIALRRSSSVAHLYARLDRGTKPRSTVKVSFPSLDFYLSTSLRPLAIAIDDATGHARSGGKKYRTRSRKKVSGRRFKTRSVGLVEAETFFCLASNVFFFFFFFYKLHFLLSLLCFFLWYQYQILFYLMLRGESPRLASCYWRIKPMIIIFTCNCFFGIDNLTQPWPG